MRTNPISTFGTTTSMAAEKTKQGDPPLAYNDYSSRSSQHMIPEAAKTNYPSKEVARMKGSTWYCV